MPEEVLVVPRSLFNHLGEFQGLSLNPDRYLPSFLDPKQNHFMPRDQAEEDPSFKQIIPYVVFRHRDRYLHYVRGSGSGESRLAAKGSIGIGGHVNRDDAAHASLDRNTYWTGVDREIEEELELGEKPEHRVVGLLNDDSNEVGAVHLGVIHLVELTSDRVRAREEEIHDLAFRSIEELQGMREHLETWSQICLDGLEQLQS